MLRECVKCGFVNATASGTATEACPQCSAIYSKATVAHAQHHLAAEQLGRRASAPAQDPWLDRWLWGFAALGAGAGLIQLGYTMIAAISAPQHAAGTGMAVGMAVIPYCLARALTRRKPS
ncbi:MAG: hypothetical protein ABIU96_04045 [Rhodanobacter sp.]